MKFLCTADWHIRKENPKYRKDDYLAAQLKKVEWIVDYANKEDATILLAGDIFDSPKAGYGTVNAVNNLLRRAKYKTVTCFGNHDTTFHSQDLSNTPYGNLLVSERIVENQIFFNGMTTIHSLGWEGVAPKPTEGDTNILLGHVSVFEKEVPFWCENGIAAKQAEKLYPGFDYYVFGDIHIPFVKGNVINPGSLTRSTIGQIDYTPGFYMLDTDNGSIEHVLLPIESKEDVFDLDQQELDSLKDVKALNSFIDTIKYSGDKPKFETVLDDVIKQAKAPQPIINIINDVLEEI